MPRSKSHPIKCTAPVVILVATSIGCATGDALEEGGSIIQIGGSSSSDGSISSDGSSSTDGAGPFDDDHDGATGGGGSEEGEGSESGEESGGAANDDDDGDDYEYSKIIRIPASEVRGTEDHDDFPVFISLIDADLHDHARDGGCDITFVQDSTLLAFELEQFDIDHSATEAKLAAWVKVPSLSTTLDTVIELKYGQSCGSYEDPTGVWGDDYELVWHMNSVVDSQTSDSTARALDGSVHGEPLVEDGKLGKSMVLDGVDDRVVGPLASELGVGGNEPRTFSVWANIQSYDSTVHGDVFGIGRLGGGCCAFNGYSIRRGVGVVSFSVGGEWSQNANWILFEDGTGFDEWVHYVAVYDGEMGLELYANGVLIQDISIYSELHNPEGDLDTLDDTPLSMPYMVDNLIGGPRDEMRVSRRVLSAGWIETEYANQSDPDGFYQVGPEVATPVM